LLYFLLADGLAYSTLPPGSDEEKSFITMTPVQHRVRLRRPGRQQRHQQLALEGETVVITHVLTLALLAAISNEAPLMTYQEGLSAQTFVQAFK
jgi:hypothetical protein